MGVTIILRFPPVNETILESDPRVKFLLLAIVVAPILTEVAALPMVRFSFKVVVPKSRAPLLLMVVNPAPVLVVKLVVFKSVPLKVLVPAPDRSMLFNLLVEPIAAVIVWLLVEFKVGYLDYWLHPLRKLEWHY